MPLRRLINLIYHLLVRHMDKKDRVKLDMELDVPDEPRTVEFTNPDTGEVDAKLEPPSWWRGEAEAHRQALDVQRWLGENR
ncbi:hypothetical protein [Desertimonas flava]|uniref:hypothetical protein n=1 Tax=Desertimonas flava TaxID=2064846 RepID=UPI000E349CC5|nr:hypothetical protein [Desertimonas flava]